MGVSSQPIWSAFAKSGHTALAQRTFSKDGPHLEMAWDRSHGLARLVSRTVKRTSVFLFQLHASAHQAEAGTPRSAYLPRRPQIAAGVTVKVNASQIQRPLPATASDRRRG